MLEVRVFDEPTKKIVYTTVNRLKMIANAIEKGIEK